MEDDPNNLAADGDEIPEGVDPPSEEERLKFLAERGWPT